MTSHYGTLGVPRDSSFEQIRSAYRRKAKDCHPDHVGMTDTRAFRDLHEAYSVLADPQRRAAYDRGLRTDAPLAHRSRPAAEPLRPRSGCTAEPLRDPGRAPPPLSPLRMRSSCICVQPRYRLFTVESRSGWGVAGPCPNADFAPCRFHRPIVPGAFSFDIMPECCGVRHGRPRHTIG